jgi:hypothetical protein
MAKKRRTPKADEATEQQKILLDQLKDVADRVGVPVREERLHREVGYSVKSGFCRLNEETFFLLDSTANTAARIEALIEFLATRDLEPIYIEPELRRMILGAAPDDSDERTSTG